MHTFLAFRILRDPAPEQSGGGSTNPPPAPASGGSPPPAARIEVTHDEYKRLQESATRLAQLDAEKKRELEAKEAERLKALAEKGDAEKALNLLREAKDKEIKDATDRANALEAERLSDKKDSALTSALLGTTFVSEAAAAQAKLILDGRFEAVRNAAGQIEVREKGTLRPAVEAIKTWLASDDAAHFIKATSTGGSGSKGADRPAPTPTGETEKPLPFDQQLVQYVKSRQAQAANTNPYAFGQRSAARN